MSEDSGNSTLVLDIQFEDGSVQKGFIKLAESSKTTSKKVEDDFKKIKLIDFEAMGEEGSNAMVRLGGEFLKFGLIASAVAVSIEGLKKSFELGLDGERIKSLNAQFDTLTKQAGIAGDALKENLERTADGLIDVDALLATANSQIINLGENAARLPAVLELARKVTNALGGDLKARFEGIASAIESGNARALKAQGIYIDQDEALKKMARSLGLNTGELNLAQRQQAILNATLEQGGKKYKDVSAEIQPATDNVKRFKVTITELIDKVAVAVADSGPFKKFTDILGDIARGEKPATNTLAGQVADMIAQRGALNERIRYLTKYPGLNKLATDDEIANLKDRISRINTLISESGAKVTQNTSAMVEAAKNQKTATELATEAELAAVKKKLTAQQDAAKGMRLLAVEEAKQQDKLSENAAEAAKTSLLQTETEKRIALVRSYNERIGLLVQEDAIKRKEIDLQYASGAIGTAAERDAKLIQLSTNTANEIARLEQQKADANKDYTLQLSESLSTSEMIVNSFKDVMLGAKNAATDFSSTSSKTFKDLGKTMLTGFSSATANAFGAFGRALATGGDAVRAFASTFINAIGGMFLQLGEGLILKGIAISLDPMTPGAGSGLIGAGAALAAFGGLLQGMSGAGGSSGATAPSSSTGGGVASNPSTTTTEVISPTDLERKKPDTYVNLTVNGDVFDSQETGLRLADILNSAFDKSGVVIRGAV